MKIGVTSDTHSIKIPRQLIEDFSHVDLIIHAGDFCTPNDAKVFSKLGEIRAVQGNMDDDGIRSRFPEKQVFICEGKRIGLYHGRGSRATILQSVMKEFEGQMLDIIIFGHSHMPFNETIKGTLYFNPGSPNDTLGTDACSYGMIEIDGGQITSKIIKVK